MSHSATSEFADIQGLVRFGHGQLSASAFLLLKIIDPVAARHWLATVEPTSALSSDPLPEQVLQIALSASGLRALGVAPAVMDQFSHEFLDGMSGSENRSRRLGDTGANTPTSWRWGGADPAAPVHLLVLLYSRPEQLDTFQAATMDDAFMRAFQLQSALVSRHNRSREPFGFEDGISQPLLDWEQPPQRNSAVHDRYINNLALGEVLLGYPNEYQLYTSRPLLDPAHHPQAMLLPPAAEHPGLRDLGRNGSYLVLRQLVQDVAGFWHFLQQQAGGDAEQREQLAAAMVGRHRDGAPLVDLSRRAIDGIASDSHDNHFDYSGDPHGRQCPLGAHLRRSNPRSGDYPEGVDGPLSRLLRTLGFAARYPGDDLLASARFHRLLRRGRVYGSALAAAEALRAEGGDDEERGLHFICLCGNISRQFEFVQNAWSMNAKFDGLAGEGDPLLGNRQPLLNGVATDRFSLPKAGAPARVIDGLPQFVTVCGGGYFFLPGLKALKFLASEPTATGSSSHGA